MYSEAFAGNNRPIESVYSEVLRLQDVEDYQIKEGLVPSDVEFESDQEANKIYYRIRYEDNSLGHPRLLERALANNPESFSAARMALKEKLQIK